MKIFYSVVMILSFVTISSCSSDILEIESVLETKNDRGAQGEIGPIGPDGLSDYQDGQVGLGEKMPEIYTVEAMREAYRQLYPNGGGQYGPSAIQTTHYYVRFLPKTDLEYCSIAHYNLSEIPLHYELKSGGSSYHDPSIPEDQYTWQYALIPVGELNTTVEYQILENRFIIDEPVSSGETRLQGRSGAITPDFYDTLEAASTRIANGGDGLQGPSGPPASKWRPSGTVKVWDDRLGRLIALEGVKVNIYNGKTNTQVVTNKAGYFVADKLFKGAVYYNIKWRGGDDFTIFDGGLMSQAYLYVGKKMSTPWTAHIDTQWCTRKQISIASIYRAGTRTYYKDYLNMSRPTFSRGMIYVRYVDGVGEANGRFRGFEVTDPLFPAIKIWGKSSSGYKRTEDIFGTAIHEFAHAGHFKQMPGIKEIQFAQVNLMIKESWAEAVEYYIRKLEYAEYGIDIDEYETLTIDPSLRGAVGALEKIKVKFIIPDDVNKQAWPFNYGDLRKRLESQEYSSLIIDLVDDNRQHSYFRTKKGLPFMPGQALQFPTDNVSHFELYRIQGVLKNSYAITSFKNNIINLNTTYYPTKNRTEDIIALFSLFNNI